MKTNKLIKYGIIFIFIAIGFFAVSIAFGSLNEDTWNSVAKKSLAKSGYYETQIEEYEEIEQSEILNLSVKLTDGNFFLRRAASAEQEKITVKYYESFEGEFSLALDGDGIYKIKQNDIGWYRNMLYDNIFAQIYRLRNFKRDFTVTVPQGFDFKSLEIEGDNGKADVSGFENGLNLQKIKLDNGSLTMKDVNITADGFTFILNNGKANIENSEAKGITGSCDNGSITLKDITVSGSLSLKSNNGRISAEKIEAGGLVKMNTDNGRIDIKGLECGSVEMKSNNGRINVENVKAPGLIKMDCDNGRINIVNITGGNIELKANNGSIVLTNLINAGQYKFVLSANNGSKKNEYANAENAVYTLTAKVDNGSVTIKK